MSKRKFMSEGGEAVAPFRRTAAPRHGKRTVEQLKTGSLEVHHKPYPPSSLLGLPRELRDEIYKYIPSEILCPKSECCYAVDPLVPVYYKNDSPTPPKYGGVAIDEQRVGVNELLHPAKLRCDSALALVCKQLRAEYLQSFTSPIIRNDTMRFIVRNYCFRDAYTMISTFRPNNVVIVLKEDEYLSSDISPDLLLWARFCKTPDDNNPKAAEIHGHKFTLTYEQNVSYDSLGSLIQAKNGIREQVHAACIITRMALISGTHPTGDMIGWNTIRNLWQHNSKIISWMERQDGMEDEWNRSWMERTFFSVLDDDYNDDLNREKYGLVDDSTILGAKRNRAQMEAGGRNDPLDAQYRIMMRRIARLSLN